MKEYDISAIYYLRRAKQVFCSNDYQTWFYTALEIRFGVEARLREYLEYQSHVSKKKKKGWKPAALTQTIDSVFKLPNQEAIFTFTSNKHPDVTLTYRPITQELVSIVEKLGDYLHAANKEKMAGTMFWETFEHLLNRGVELLEYAISGEMLGAPLKSPEGKVAVFAVVDSEIAEIMAELLKEPEVIINVEYHEIS